MVLVAGWWGGARRDTAAAAAAAAATVAAEFVAAVAVPCAVSIDDGRETWTHFRDTFGEENVKVDKACSTPGGGASGTWHSGGASSGGARMAMEAVSALTVVGGGLARRWAMASAVRRRYPP